MRYFRRFGIVVCPSVWLSVCLSVCPSVMLCLVALRVGVVGWKLYHGVPRTAVPIHFFRHFLCRMYRSATKKTTKTQAAEISALKILMGSMVVVVEIAQQLTFYRQLSRLRKSATAAGLSHKGWRSRHFIYRQLRGNPHQERFQLKWRTDWQWHYVAQRN